MTTDDGTVNIQPLQVMDLRQTKCPLNFVKTKLALEKLAVGDVLEVWIALDGESAINIPNSIRQEGHMVIKTETYLSEHYQQLFIQKS